MGIIDKASSLFSQLTGKGSESSAAYSGGGRTGYFPPVTKQKKQTVSGTVRTKGVSRQQTTTQQNAPNFQGQAQQAFYGTSVAGTQQSTGYQQQNYTYQGNSSAVPQGQVYTQNGGTQQGNYGNQFQGTAFQNPQGNPQQPQNRRNDDTGFGRSPYGQATQGETGYQVSNTDYYTHQNTTQFAGYTDDLGRSWRQRTNIVCLDGLRGCYDCIDGMSSGQSIVVNLEKIQDDRERQRCMDLLTGAAYVLGCRTTQVDYNKDVFLFTAGNVYLYMDNDVAQMNSRQHFSRNEEQQSSSGRTYGFNRSRYA